MPARYRSGLVENYEGKLIVTLGVDQDCLMLYPVPEYKEIEQKLVKLPALNSKAKRLQRLIIGHATECELDGQGRFLIPEPLRKIVKLEKRVALVGQGNKFEIWDEDTWNTCRAKWIEEERSEQDAELPPELESLSL